MSQAADARTQRDAGGFEVCVIGGAGHVGLPLAIVFASKGLRALILDVNAAALARIGRGEMPFAEAGGDALLREVLDHGLLAVGTDCSLVAGIPFLVLTIGTPVDEFLNPVHRVLTECLDPFLPYLTAEQTLILRSTVSPGATDWLCRHLERMGKPVQVAFCPERVVQGRAVEEIQRLPQIVSGMTPAAVERATWLFAKVAPEIVPLAPMEAELAKLYCNSYRYIQFAVSNQFFMMAASQGLDYERIVAGMKAGYARMSDFPGAGFAAGPCLYKDTMQLCAFYNNEFSLGFDAMRVNEGLPLFLVRHLESKYDLRPLTVGLLGMAFKANSDDVRSSLSFKLRKALQTRAAAVLCADPHVKDEPRLLPAAEVIARSDLLILCVPHQAFRGLDTGNKPVLDIWGFLRQQAGGHALAASPSISAEGATP